MTKIKIYHRDLMRIIEHAKDNLVTMPPRANLQGMVRALTEAERLAASYALAAYMVAGSLGVDTSAIVIVFENPDSETIE